MSDDADDAEEMMDEIYHEGVVCGYTAGFDRCLELVAWAGRKVGLTEAQIVSMSDLLVEGPKPSEALSQFLAQEK
jgi:hypothetical protein